MQNLSMNDIKQFTDDVLYQNLKNHRLDIGPVVESTRSIYEKRLFTKQNMQKDKVFNDSSNI